MDARTRLRERLTAGPLLADGAMGTLLFARGIPQRAVLDELVATRPELIGAIHREYLAAGADIIATATFGANRPRLAPFGLGDQAGRLARRGGQLAREAGLNVRIVDEAGEVALHLAVLVVAVGAQALVPLGAVLGPQRVGIECEVCAFGCGWAIGHGTSFEVAAFTSAPGDLPSRWGCSAADVGGNGFFNAEDAARAHARQPNPGRIPTTD